MAITLTQHTSVDAGSPAGNSTTLAYGSNNAAGALLVCCARVGAGAQTFSVTDSAGNTWQAPVESVGDGGGTEYAVLYAMNAAAGANTVTLHWTTSGVSVRFTISEYAGAATSAALDQHTSTGSISSTSLASGSVTPTTDNQLIVGLQGTSANVGYTQTAGMTVQEQQPAGVNNQKIAYVDVIQTTATAINNTATLSSATNWAAIVATFKAAVGGATVNPTAGIQRPPALPWDRRRGQAPRSRFLYPADVGTPDLVTTGQIAELDLQGVSSTATVGGVSVAGQTATLNLSGITAAAAVGGVSTAGQVATVNLQGVAGTATVGAVSKAGQVATVDLQGVASGVTVGAVTVAGQTAVLNLQGVGSSASPPTTTAGQTATLNLQGIASTATVGGVSKTGTVATVNLQGVSSGVTVGAVTVTGQVGLLNLQGVGGSGTSSGGAPQSQAGGTAVLNLQGVGHTATGGPVTTAGQTALLELRGAASTPAPGAVSKAGQTAILELRALGEAYSPGTFPGTAHLAADAPSVLLGTRNATVTATAVAPSVSVTATAPPVTVTAPHATVTITAETETV